MTTTRETIETDGSALASATTAADRLERAWSTAHELLAAFGLDDWRFEFMSCRATRRFGDCNHAKKTIRLSPVLTVMNEMGEVEETIRHEIAHALCRPTDGHNSAFYAMCRTVGATPARCCDATVNAPPQQRRPRRYRRRCPTCERTWYYRGPIHAARACGQCRTLVIIEKHLDAGWQPE